MTQTKEGLLLRKMKLAGNKLTNQEDMQRRETSNISGNSVSQICTPHEVLLDILFGFVWFFLLRFI
jgi:hypothetical protein